MLIRRTPTEPTPERMDCGVILSDCGLFRYDLTRMWSHHAPLLLFMLLNPSTADHMRNDPTAKKCMGFARRLGYGGIRIMNLWAYRTKSPLILKQNGYLVGPHNQYWLENRLEEHSEVICGWGVNANCVEGKRRMWEVEEAFRKHGVKMLALQVNDNGMPTHPLMLPYSCTTIPYSLPPM